MQRRAAIILLGLIMSGATVVTEGGAVNAAVPRGLIAPSGPAASVGTETAANRPPRCRYVRGHWRWDYRRGRRVWVSRHRICR